MFSDHIVSNTSTSDSMDIRVMYCMCCSSHSYCNIPFKLATGSEHCDWLHVVRYLHDGASLVS